MSNAKITKKLNKQIGVLIIN